MAKRRRLTPANPTFLGGPEEEAAPLETKSAFPMGVAQTRTRSRAPIAEVAAEASAAAALSELSDALQQARDEGRLVQVLALSEVESGHMVRDRIIADEEELQALVESLRARGQQTPIEVVDRGAGAVPRYGLISGWRRLAALGRLAREDQKFDRVLALVRAPKSAADAYVAMVEENEIRVGLSYYERARIAMKAVEQGVYPEVGAALRGLFANVSRAKRSKIRSFTVVVDCLDGALRFPTAIGERLGLELAKRLTEERGAAARLRKALEAASPETAEAEQAILLRRPPAAKAPVAKAPAPPAVALSYDAEAGRLVLSGPGVDQDLRKALEAWLKRR
ncbi:ParB N-terminal domain-containing protein [Pseudooceanicola sp. CBS1P-1]|uniref:ParB-like N-terminal domain-containing protein n=1 Tax=Pseudooceanicola albus TaxID=2692189 RepID=A0A6L7G9Z6_9RHOB|nr:MULTISPECIES: ParB N-terminal domain-containing protein [Pseudooceanicola]MBT9386748.1 ParB N-terminal domain-containing protein [Pseudooceanicola endophyticus]MXN20769.1 hypothetical protein [Pseudooceanicola albus]